MSHAAQPRLVVDLARGYALSEFYPLSHPTLMQALMTLAEALLHSAEHFSLTVTPGGVVLGGGGLVPRSAHVDRLAARLGEHGVTTLLLRNDIGADALGRVLSGLALPPRVARAAGGLTAALEAAGAARVAVDGRWIEPSAGSPSTLDRRADQRPGDPGIELWSAHDMYEVVRQSAARVDQESTDELRRMLREGSDSQRVDVLTRLELVAQHFLNAGDLDRGIALVEALRRDAEQ
ncbi:MAG TPA: hypothetical protein VNP72_08720, partial [Longimicrobium sp.]|nr:hypothetical protein [Longimicrobium sp.]